MNNLELVRNLIICNWSKVNYLEKKPEPSIVATKKMKREKLPTMAVAQLLPSDEIFEKTIFLGSEYRTGDYVILGNG